MGRIHRFGADEPQRRGSPTSGEDEAAAPTAIDRMCEWLVAGTGWRHERPKPEHS